VRQDEQNPEHSIITPFRFIFDLKPAGDDMKDFQGKTAFVTGGPEGQDHQMESFPRQRKIITVNGVGGVVGHRLARRHCV